MRHKLCKSITCSVLLALMLAINASAGAEKPKNRTFLLIGNPNAAGWKILIDDPADRKEQVSGAMEAIGGKIVSYYFGLGDGKNYITVELPDDTELIQAVYIMRLPSGVLSSYEMIELLPSAQMAEALKKAKALVENDTTL